MARMGRGRSGTSESGGVVEALGAFNSVFTAYEKTGAKRDVNNMVTADRITKLMQMNIQAAYEMDPQMDGTDVTNECLAAIYRSRILQFFTKPEEDANLPHLKTLDQNLGAYVEKSNSKGAGGAASSSQRQEGSMHYSKVSHSSSTIILSFTTRRITTAKLAVVPRRVPCPSETSTPQYDVVSRGLLSVERRVTRSMSRPGETVEETERRMLEELRQCLGPLPGAIDTPKGSTQGDDFYPPLPLEPPPQPTGLSEPPTVRTGSEDSGQTPRPREGNTGGRLSPAGSEVVGGTEEEATTQKMMLAIMNMMMEMNKDMIAERKHREEQEKKKEQETGGGIVLRGNNESRGPYRVRRIRTEESGSWRQCCRERKAEEKGQSTAKFVVLQPKTTNWGRAIPTDLDELNRRWPRPSADEVLKHREEGKCTGCGEKGHYNRDWPVIAAKVKAGIIPVRSFGQGAGGEGRFSTGGNAIPLGDRRKINAIGGEEASMEGQGMDEEEKDGDPSR
ncbi:hypothetical protein TREMEDRAFT_66391 [Tremella mesenterica DSM 1558]|uniref:uncharacterized protein n=1 Tax=Tremella mesenterica (strain ATCC 24925 / CBS 8224 / DSM 1558 / NBRC 9311 / NRRL Y-6157 / RJB 2259-6 / UBC 559-6) TaxID=578456 RepID=UPI00032C2A26|nr:uncharacterized protein TREMEDRAFT_66391 [Tremella mesenterica DSM 1558]EIW65663.1 hypothetical protein TREMEDRAFT_66391 [Tremella mesenterica DSM 1558]